MLSNKHKNPTHKSAQACWPEPVPVFVEEDDNEDLDGPELPLLHAASCALMRQMIADNPEADFFTLYEQNHVEVDPWISVPLFMAKGDWTEVIPEVMGELLHRHPEASFKELFDRLMDTIEPRQKLE